MWRGGIAYYAKGLLSVIEFKKQMYMIPTKDDLIYEVCAALGRSEDDAVLSLVDKLLLMFERQQLLQQTPCTTKLPLPNDEEIAAERKAREFQTFQFDIGAAWMRSKAEAIS